MRALLRQAGAACLKSSVYVLPCTPTVRAALERIAKEVRDGGGQAFVCDATFPDEASRATVVEGLRAERRRGYAAVISAARRGVGRGPAGRRRLARLRQRIRELGEDASLDVPLRSSAEAALEQLERRIERADPAASPSPWVGKTWVTRRGVLVDRIACAWLVRRFLDPAARFRFLAVEARPRPGEIRFDMGGGELTHEGDRCTFETLLGRTAIVDPALAAVAEIVHDVDLKDGKFGRPEARGFEQLLLGVVRASADDEERLEGGFVLLDALYRSFPGARLRRRR